MGEMKMPSRNNNPNLLKVIPNWAIKSWKENCWRELNRFAKLSSTPFIVSIQGERIPWHKRINTDLQRARRLDVVGDVNEVFEFPNFKTLEEKEYLVETCLKFLKTAIEDLISELVASLGVEGRKALAEKAVNQALISLCQDFVNDPYFKILKESCEKFDLTPTSTYTADGDWRSGISIKVDTPLLHCQVCRTFKTMQITDIEATETDIVFGFKRTYVIDILGGPPRILPPVFLARDSNKAMEFLANAFPKANPNGVNEEKLEGKASEQVIKSFT